MKIYRIWKINMGAYQHDKEMAFFTSKKKAIDFIKTAGHLESLRDKRDYGDPHKTTFYNPIIHYTNPSKKEIIEFNAEVNKCNLIYEVKHTYNNGIDSYYIETIHAE